MREVFRNELDELAVQLVEMSTRVFEAIRLSNQALRNNDLDLAEQVIEADIHIDRLQHGLDQQAAEILALQAPVAADLRAVIGALRMSASLERMGDLARHIAQQVRIRYPENAIPDHFSHTFVRMGESAEKIAEATENLLSNPGLEVVPTINAIDEELDELHLSIFSKIGEAPAGGLAPHHIADVTLLSRYYERFGDHAVSVSQKVEYLLTGNWEPDLSKK